MSRVTFAALLLSCAAAPLGGCNLTYDREAVEFPPTIRPLTLGVAVSGTIATTAQRDTWEFVVPAGGLQVRFQTFDGSGTTCNNIDPWIELFDASMVLEGSSDDSGIYNCEDYSIDLPAGTHYVVVSYKSYYAPPFDYVLKSNTGTYGGSLVTLSCDEPPSTGWCEQITGTLSLTEVASYEYWCGATYARGPCPASTITGYCDGGAYSSYGTGTTHLWIYYDTKYTQVEAESECAYYSYTWVP